MAQGNAGYQEGIAAAEQLVAALASGWQPSPIPVRMSLTAGEHCLVEERVQLHQLLEGDGTYLHKTRFGLNAVGLTMAAATVVGNSHRKRKAAREAAARFRPVDQGVAFITNRRFALHGASQWTDIWYSDIRMSGCDGHAIELAVAGIPALRLQMWPAWYHFAMFRWLSQNEIITIPRI